MENKILDQLTENKILDQLMENKKNKLLDQLKDLNGGYVSYNDIPICTCTSTSTTVSPNNIYTNIDPTIPSSLTAYWNTNATGGFGPISFSWPKTTELAAEEIVSTADIKDDPSGMEEYIRSKLAVKLAQKLIEEDLVVIQSNEEATTDTTIIRAKIKIMQE